MRQTCELYSSCVNGGRDVLRDEGLHLRADRTVATAHTGKPPPGQHDLGTTAHPARWAVPTSELQCMSCLTMTSQRWHGAAVVTPPGGSTRGKQPGINIQLESVQPLWLEASKNERCAMQV